MSRVSLVSVTAVKIAITSRTVRLSNGNKRTNLGANDCIIFERGNIA